MASLIATETVAPDSVVARPYVGVLADSVSVRRIRAVLGPDSVDVVATAARADTLLDRALVPLDVAVVAADLEALGRSGPIGLLRNLRPDLPLVFVCRSDDRAAVSKSLRAGVHGFVSQSNLETGLQPTIEAVVAGQLAVPQFIRRRVTWGTFSLREKQVLQLAASGLTNAEIACRLYLSESTVKSHLSSSFRKLGVSSRSEAAAAVLDPDTGLVSPQPPAPLQELEQQLLGYAAA